MSSTRRPIVAAALLAVGAVGLGGCFTTTADFRADAETFIVENDGLRDAVFLDAESAFVEATCTEPANQDEGTSFPCTATDSNGDVWEFEIVITGSNEYEVNVARRPAGA